MGGTWNEYQDGVIYGLYQRVFHLQGVAPSGSDRSIDVQEDGSHTFSAGDFGFIDSDGNHLSGSDHCDASGERYADPKR